MAQTITPALMFEGKAEEAMNLYVSVFENSRVENIERWQPGQPGAAGSIKRARFVIAGQTLFCMDSPAHHAFSFTPSMSLFVDCASEAQLDAAYAQLSANGKVLMPPGNYGFSRKFAWIDDRYGVSWQLNVP